MRTRFQMGTLFQIRDLSLAQAFTPGSRRHLTTRAPSEGFSIGFSRPSIEPRAIDRQMRTCFQMGTLFQIRDFSLAQAFTPGSRTAFLTTKAPFGGFQRFAFRPVVRISLRSFQHHRHDPRR